MTISRRGLLGKVAVVGGSFLLANSDESVTAALALQASSKEPKDQLPVIAYEVKALPFKPENLNGISERLIISHHDKNYAGAVKRLGAIQESLSKLPTEAPAHIVGSLMREKLIATNSMILHELYFGNLGGDGRIGGEIERLIKQSFGSKDAWERNFRQTGQALSGGSGWVMLSYSPHDKRLHNVWSPDHTVTMAGGVPLLVMDMYEHAYQMDYGADAKQYIDAFFKNINWSEVEGRTRGFA